MTGLCTELEEQIEAKLREFAARPERLDFDCRDGLLIVRGSATADEADQICAALRRIPGIDEVQNRVRIYEQ